jgi:hypothetical protein
MTLCVAMSATKAVPLPGQGQDVVVGEDLEWRLLEWVEGLQSLQV